MKKICFALILTLSLVLTSVLALSNRNAKAEEDTLVGQVAFTEDFESYSKNVENMATKWTSGYYNNQGDYNVGSCSPDNYELIAEPGNETNTILHINTAATNGSFFYLTFKDVITKNYVLEFDFMDLYNTAIATSPWFGVMSRKPVDGRYNGVTNVMNTIRSWSANNLSWQAYRSVDDSFTTVATCYGSFTCSECGESETVTSDVKACPVCGSEVVTNSVHYSLEDGTTKGTWLHAKFTAQDSTFAVYIEDVKIGEVEINKKTASNAGVVSLAACVAEIYIDNITLTRGANDVDKLDEGATTPTVTAAAPTMQTTEYTVKAGEDLTVNVSLYGEAITSIKQAATEVMTKYYEVGDDTVTISSEFLANYTAGSRKMFVITTAGGSVAFNVVIEADTPSGDTTTEAPVVTTTTASEVVTTTASNSGSSAKSGCGSIIGISSLGIVLVAGAAVLVIKKREE